MVRSNSVEQSPLYRERRMDGFVYSSASPPSSKYDLHCSKRETPPAVRRGRSSSYSSPRRGRRRSSRRRSRSRSNEERSVRKRRREDSRRRKQRVHEEDRGGGEYEPNNHARISRHSRNREHRHDRKGRQRARRRSESHDRNYRVHHERGLDGAAPTRAAGIVSDDDEQHHTAATFPTAPALSTATDRPRDGNRSPSFHNDMAGHFQGGPGTVIANRYRIVQQVGLGTFGKVMECLDLHGQRHQHHPNQRGGQGSSYVAIKIVRSVSRYSDSAKIEAQIVRQINRRGGRGVNNCVILHDSFTFSNHFCMVFESLGPSLYDFMKRNNYNAFPMICIQDFAIQLLETMEFLHSFGLIHTDLKIENILLINCRETSYRNQRVPQSTRIKLIDFGGACYDNAKKSTVINTRQYRAPEVIMEAGWSMPSDMWSLGCILAELYRGELLFPTHENIEHLGLIERTLGPFPRRLLKNATKFADTVFGTDGRHRMGRVLKDESHAFVKTAPSLKQVVRNPDDDWFLNLLTNMLRIDPDERWTAHESLRYLSRIKRDVVRCA